MSYTVGQIPRNGDTDALIRFLFSELKKIEQEFAELNPNRIQFQPHYNDDLVKVQEGLTAFFKPAGSQTKDGLYTYNNGTWNQNS